MHARVRAAQLKKSIPVLPQLEKFDCANGLPFCAVVHHERRFLTMLCPYCRNPQTEVFKTLFRRCRTYRYRRC
jgi:hypothetical protein